MFSVGAHAMDVAAALWKGQGRELHPAGWLGAP